METERRELTHEEHLAIIKEHQSLVITCTGCKKKESVDKKYSMPNNWHIFSVSDFRYVYNGTYCHKCWGKISENIKTAQTNWDKIPYPKWWVVAQ